MMMKKERGLWQKQMPQGSPRSAPQSDLLIRQTHQTVTQHRLMPYPPLVLCLPGGRAIKGKRNIVEECNFWEGEEEEFT